MIQQTTTAQATLGSLTKEYVAYNLWANKTLVEWLKQKDAALLDQHVASSFPSIRKSIAHIADTQQFWLSILQEKTEAGVDLENCDTQTVLNYLVKQSEDFVDFVSMLTEDEIVEKVYLDTPWVKGSRSRFEFSQHVMNHSTYHRGQVVTIGRQLGFTDAPMTDFNFYLMMG